MTASEDKPLPRLIGEYLPCSKGARAMALKKKLEAKMSGRASPLIGQILMAMKAISGEDLQTALRKQRADRLGQCQVFASLNATELLTLGNKFHEVAFPAGKQFITQGDRDRTMYVIASGRAEVFMRKNNGRMLKLAEIGAGDPVGEMGYFEGPDMHRLASVRCIDPTETLRVNYDDMTEYFEAVPHVAHAFMMVIQERHAINEQLLSEQGDDTTAS